MTFDDILQISPYSLDKEEKGRESTFGLSNGILIHRGGWKKLAGGVASPEKFSNTFYKKTTVHAKEKESISKLWAA